MREALFTLVPALLRAPLVQGLQRRLLRLVGVVAVQPFDEAVVRQRRQAVRVKVQRPRHAVINQRSHRKRLRKAEHQRCGWGSA